MKVGSIALLGLILLTNVPVSVIGCVSAGPDLTIIDEEEKHWIEVRDFTGKLEDRVQVGGFLSSCGGWSKPRINPSEYMYSGIADFGPISNQLGVIDGNIVWFPDPENQRLLNDKPHHLVARQGNIAFYLENDPDYLNSSHLSILAYTFDGDWSETSLFEYDLNNIVRNESILSVDYYPFLIDRSLTYVFIIEKSIVRTESNGVVIFHTSELIRWLNIHTNESQVITSELNLQAHKIIHSSKADELLILSKEADSNDLFHIQSLNIHTGDVLNLYSSLTIMEQVYDIGSEVYIFRAGSENLVSISSDAVLSLTGQFLGMNQDYIITLISKDSYQLTGFGFLMVLMLLGGGLILRKKNKL